MKTRTLGLTAAAALGLAACGGINSDEDNANLTAAPGVEGMGENATMMNDMTTANDVAISNTM